MSTGFVSLMLLIYGTVLGSYFNVVGYRLTWWSHKSSRYSKCPQCRKRLTVSELIPVISYIIQRGQCRNCQRTISIIYPIIELLTGILFVWSYLKVGWSEELIFYLLLISFSAIISVSDYWHYRIPNHFLLMFAPILVMLSPVSWQAALLGAVIQLIMLVIVMVCTKKESLGMGDVKLLILLGAIFGWKSSLWIVWWASVLALISFYKQYRGHQSHAEAKLPFGPYICLGAMIVLFTQ